MHKSASAATTRVASAPREFYKQRARRAHTRKRDIYIQTGVQERSFKRGGRCQVIYSFVYISAERVCVG
jgi:hypothetical protein